jgi:hypothetical protein
MNDIHLHMPGIEAKLDRIIELLEKQTTHNCESCVNTATRYVAEALRQDTQEDTQDAGEVNTQPEAETPAAATEASPATPEQPAVNLEDVRKLVVTLSAAGKKAEVKEIVQAVAPCVRDIPEDKLPEVWAALIALEAELIALEAELKAELEAEEEAKLTALEG